MSILVDGATRVLIQGITGREGSFHARLMREYGTQIVGGVTPGKGGSSVEGIPVFDSVAEAMAATRADATVLFVPAAAAADGAAEAATAGVPLIVVTADGVPAHQLLRLLPLVRERGCRLIGPNCPGLISPGRCKVGFMPDGIFRPGPVGVISRSGSFSYEVCQGLSAAGLGQSTVVGIGGDTVRGTSFLDLLPMFMDDPETRAVIMLGEIGGQDEERAAAWLRANRPGKPVVAYLGGRQAPERVRMGHPGAVWQAGAGTWESKRDMLVAAGAAVAEAPWEIPGLVAAALA